MKAAMDAVDESTVIFTLLLFYHVATYGCRSVLLILEGVARIPSEFQIRKVAEAQIPPIRTIESRTSLI